MSVMGTLYTLAAPSGAGKTSLVAALVESIADLTVSISYTTRAQRSNEREGVNYFFVSDAQFNAMVEEKRFLEHARVFGHQYGTAQAWVEQQLAAGIDVILEIDWQGARQIQMAMPQGVGIFILPPSVQTLRTRLEARGQDKPEVIEQRMSEAKQEISHYHEYDYVIVNDDFVTALADLQAIIRSRRLHQDRQQDRHRHLLQTLLS